MRLCNANPWLAILVAILASTASSARTSSAPVAPARTDNAVLHIRVTGHGPAMLLIPGLTCDGAVYDSTVAHFASRYTCHVVTLGGFAGQPRYEGPFLDTARDSLLAYVRRNHLVRPVIVGHSLGGVLALQLAIAAPDATGPLVILDSLPFLGGVGQMGATKESIAAQMKPMCDMIRNESQADFAAFQAHSPYLKEMVTSPADLATVTGWSVASDHAATADAMFDVYTVDLRTDLPRIKVPVLVLGSWYGMRAMTNREAVEKTFQTQYESLPQARIAVADSSRHFLMLDAPVWTWSRMDAFLAAAAGAKAAR
jgi:pimeloyl-ACP methyl ester carboxylesterase